MTISEKQLAEILAQNRAFLAELKEHVQATGGNPFDLPPFDLEVHPGLVRPGETVLISLCARGATSPEGLLTKETDYLGHTPGKPEAMPVYWEKAGDDKWKATCPLVAERAGNGRVVWQVEGHQMSRVFGVAVPGRVVITPWVGINFPRVDAELHQYSLPGDGWVWELLATTKDPARLISIFRDQVRDAWRYGDRLVPFCNAQELFPGIDDKNIFKLPLEFQREGIRFYQELWAALGLKPLEIFGSYTAGHDTFGVLEELGFKALNSLCVWQNWLDGESASDWQINHVGCPIVPYYPAADDFRKVSPRRGIIAYTMGTATSIRCYNIMGFEGCPSNSMWGLRYRKLPGIGSNVHRFHAALDGWIQDARNNAEPYFATIGIEQFWRCMESKQANADGIDYAVRRAREGSVVFASAADIADFYQRHYPRQPETVNFQPDVMAGWHDWGKPVRLPDRIETVNHRFHSLHTEGDALPQFLWDHLAPWKNAEWDDQCELRNQHGVVVPESIAATVNPLGCRPQQTDLREVQADIEVTSEAEGVCVRVRVQSMTRLNTLPLAVWHLPLDGTHDVSAQTTSAQLRWLTVREDASGNHDGLVILHDVPIGESEYTVRVSGKKRPYAVRDFTLDGLVAGRVMKLSEETRTYFWRERLDQRMTIEIAAPPGCHAKVMYPDGVTETSAADGKLEIVLDERWQREGASLINTVPVQCGGNYKFKVTRIQPVVLTPYVRDWQVSRVVPWTAGLEDLCYPADRNSLRFEPRQFRTDFADVHLVELNGVTDNSLLFFSMRFHCSIPTRLVAHLGYDGPLKAWIDGRTLFLDEKGTNPAFIKAEPAFDAEAGEHELLMALSANGGKAWGVLLRFLWEGKAFSREKDAPLPDQKRPVIDIRSFMVQ